MSLICTDWELLLLAVELEEDCKIAGFSGDFRFLSNFYPGPITYEGILYPTAEHAYQAAKGTDRAVKESIAALPSPGRAKRFRQPLREDWAEVRREVMEEIVDLKFRTHADLRAKLCATGECLLEETNTWNDRFWGVCNGEGENHLGKILMAVRARLRTPAGKISA